MAGFFKMADFAGKRIFEHVFFSNLTSSFRNGDFFMLKKSLFLLCGAFLTFTCMQVKGSSFFLFGWADPQRRSLPQRRRQVQLNDDI